MWVVLVDFLKADARRQILLHEGMYDYSGVWNEVQLKHIFKEKPESKKWSSSLFFILSIKSFHYRMKMVYCFAFCIAFQCSFSNMIWWPFFHLLPLAWKILLYIIYIYMYIYAKCIHIFIRVETGHCFQFVKKCFHELRYQNICT